MSQKERIIQLYKEFNDYANSAEQFEFVMLAVIEMALLATLSQFEEKPDFTLSEEGERAMFRTVYHVMGDEREEEYLPDEKGHTVLN